MPTPTFRHHPAFRALFMLFVVGLAGCAARGASTRDGVSSRQDGQEPGGLVLTQQDISEMGVRDAYHAVERAATHLKIQRTREGSPVKITQRGVSSFLLSADILVVVDGARVQTVVDHLKNIPAESILFIQILNAREASARYGSEAGNGVIMVRTAAM
jgi:outer membrane receptor for ferrienterochelin and colicin